MGGKCNVEVYSPATGQTRVIDVRNQEEAQQQLLAMNSPEKAFLHHLGLMFGFTHWKNHERTVEGRRTTVGARSNGMQGRTVTVYSPATGQTRVIDVSDQVGAQKELIAMNSPEKAFLHHFLLMFRRRHRRGGSDH